MGWPSVLAICFVQKKNKIPISLSQEVVLQIGDRHLSSHSDWEIGMVSSMMIAFQRSGSQICEKDSLGLGNWHEALKTILYLKKTEKYLQVQYFQGNAVSKEKTSVFWPGWRRNRGPRDTESSFMQFNPSERNVKAVFHSGFYFWWKLQVLFSRSSSPSGSIPKPVFLSPKCFPFQTIPRSLSLMNSLSYFGLRHDNSLFIDLFFSSILVIAVTILEFKPHSAICLLKVCH